MDRKDNISAQIFLSSNCYEPMKFFTPPYETIESLRKRLQGMYAGAEIGNIKSIAYFTCRKAGMKEAD